MRTMLIALAAVLLASPLSTQAGGPAAVDAWRMMPMPDARLRPDFGGAQRNVEMAEARSRMSLPTWMLLGAAIGCGGGTLLMASGADDADRPEMRFNGCVLGGAAGMFLGGISGLISGANR